MSSRPRLVKINDEGGRGLAEVEGKWLAILHERHWNFHNKTYSAPIAASEHGTKRMTDYLDALRRHDLIVLQRDQPLPGDALAFSTYIGVFRFRDLMIEPETFTLTLVERYASPSA